MPILIRFPLWRRTGARSYRGSWKAGSCSRLLDLRVVQSLEQLVEGKFPKALEVLFQDRKYGLFQSPKEIHFDCSCPDWASMCKHVAAVIYGVGARLDQNPMLFFELRHLDGRELVKKSMEAKLESMLKNAGKKSEREIQAEELEGLFGFDVEKLPRRSTQ